MPIDPHEAAAALGDVARIEQRTRAALYYGGSSAIMALWGIAWMVGDTITYASPRHAELAWLIIDAIGAAGSIVIALARVRARARNWDWRISAAFLVLMGFGFLWQFLLGGQQWREISVFWPTLFMCGYILAGLWIGRFFILCGVVVTALIMAGYLWLGPLLPLWLGFVGGGSLILGGLWLRRRAALP